jgi:hypothetical protein
LKRVPFVLFLFALGCGSDIATSPATHRDAGDHGHSHERGTMKLADLGPYHAGLTAHLSSKTGNELDIVIETADAAHKPVALPLQKLMARAKTSSGQEHELSFEPSEPDERKDDPPGKCSRFTARAAWMKAEELLTVSARIDVAGKSHEVIWKDFIPKKYAHFEE